MENMGDENPEKNLENALPESNNSQEELEALLQQSQVGNTKTTGSILPKGIGKKVNWLIVGIVSLAVVLLTLTIYFLDI